MSYFKHQNNILNHILGWFIVILINIVILMSYSSNVEWMIVCWTWCGCIALFYINFLVLIPYLLFRKRLALYLASLLVLLTLSFIGVKSLQVETFNRYLLRKAKFENRQLPTINTKVGPVYVMGGTNPLCDTLKIFPYTSILDMATVADTVYFLTVTDTIIIEPRWSVDISFKDDTVTVAQKNQSLEYNYQDDTMSVLIHRDKFFTIERHPMNAQDTALLAAYTNIPRPSGRIVPMFFNPNRKEAERMRFYHSPYNPISRRNQPLFFTLILALTASVALSFIRKWKEEERKNMEIKREKTEAELTYLKQQINPHFLFNTLNAIYSYTLAVPTPASDAIIKLSSMLRYMIYDTAKNKANLSDEVEIVKDYIELQKLRLTEHTTVTFNLNGNITGYGIEPMLLIPILENAFKFGVDSLEHSFIDIYLEVADDRLLFEVSNKIVVNNKRPNESSGVGIKNIRRRLDLIYENNYKFTTMERDGNFYVSLELKLTR